MEHPDYPSLSVAVETPESASEVDMLVARYRRALEPIFRTEDPADVDRFFDHVGSRLTTVDPILLSEADVILAALGVDSWRDMRNYYRQFTQMNVQQNEQSTIDDSKQAA